jgi:hypothetical protein
VVSKGTTEIEIHAREAIAVKRRIEEIAQAALQSRQYAS